MHSFAARFALSLIFPVCLVPALARGTEQSPEFDQLANDPVWLRLVHYETDRSSPSGWRSAIHSKEFFLASDGAVNPRAELLATLSNMSYGTGANSDDQAQCRFPARRQWLATRLGDTAPFRIIACPKFDSWTKNRTVESISIVFATGYLGNPASYYGHTFLKLNFKEGDEHTSLQDVSINYGAIDTLNDDPVSYIFKGISGGYDGGFSDFQYYVYDFNYGDNELRDLWEYRLELPPDAIEMIVAHAWEVLGQRYNYYFFRRNCAFRMAELVEIADGLDVIPENRPWTLPQAVLQKLAVTDLHGQKVVSEVIYHPSRQSRFYQKYLNLSSDERKLLAALVLETETLDGAHFQEQPLDSKHAVLDALIDYYQFIAEPDERAKGVVNPGYAKALSVRYRLPPGSRTLAVEKKVAPDRGRKPSWIQLGWLHGNALGESMLLRIRPAYYDSLDADSSHIPNAGLAMGDLQLRIDTESVKVHRFDLIAIESVNPALSGLPGDRGYAWRLRAGVEPLRLNCSDCLVPRLQGDMGVGRQFGKTLFATAYVGGAIQENRQNQGLAFGRISTSINIQPITKVTAKLSYEHRIPIHEPQAGYDVTEAELRLALGTNSDFRIRHEHDGGEVTTIGVGLYW